MNIINKLPLMAFVLGLGLMLSMSSFVRSGLNANQETKTYYHVGDSFVETAPNPSQFSCQNDDFSCTIVFEGSSVPTVTDFPEGSIPSGPWSATPQTANRSWKLIP